MVKISNDVGTRYLKPRIWLTLMYVFVYLDQSESVAYSLDPIYINVTAGYGRENSTIYTVVDEDIPITAGTERCLNLGYGLHIDEVAESNVYTFILHYMTLLGWATSRQPGGRFIKSNIEWYRYKHDETCEVMPTFAVENNTEYVQQCAALNTTNSGQNPQWFALSCDNWRPFICVASTNITIEVNEYTNMTFIRESVDRFEFLPSHNTTDQCLAALRNSSTGVVAEFVTEDIPAAVNQIGGCYIGFVNVTSLPTVFQIKTSDTYNTTLWIKDFTSGGDKVEIVGTTNAQLQLNWTLPTLMPCAHQETFEAYPGITIARTFDIYSDKRNWLEAEQSCSDAGADFIGFHTLHVFKYVKNTALNANWPADDHIAVGVFKNEYHSDWFVFDTCVKRHYHIANEIPGTRQCALLNISSDDPNDILYGSDCSIPRSYLCVVKGQSVLVSPTDDYREYPNRVIKTFYSEASGSVGYHYLDSLNLCLEESHQHNFLSFGCEYDYELQLCKIYFTTPYNLPLNVTLAFTEKNVTVLLKNASRVFFKENFNSSAVNISDIDGLCPQPTTTTTTMVPTVAANNCTCDCTHKNKTMEQVMAQIEEMKKELIVPKRTLSSYTRQKTSATDNRPSSVTMGTVGILILVIVSALVIIADIPYIILILKKCKEFKSYICQRL